ncbi:hypothetical protein [Flavobacterium sp.]|uniref:hypothetical protein n=1 Tax=Flavobacterium sp. TaxID=239 RepID=UPI003F69C651
MKNTFPIYFLFFCISLFAQNNTIDPGIYNSQGLQKGIQLKVNEDKTYEMILLKGTISTKNDSLYFSNNKSSSSSFKVIQHNSTITKDSLVLVFNGTNMYGIDVYYGLQNTLDEKVNYQSISKNYDYAFGNENEATLNIGKAKYFCLLEYIKGKSYVSKYQLNANISKIEVNYNYAEINKLEFTGIAKEDKSISLYNNTINNSNRELFSFVNEEINNNEENLLIPIIYEIEEDFKIQEEDNLSYPEEIVESKYKFKLVVDGSLKEALNTLNKSPNKFLVITYNPNNKNETRDFNEFIQNYEKNLSYEMYEEYVPEYDKYNFYLATSKDKKIFDEKLNIPQIAIVNSKGNKIYHTTGTLAENDKLFENYNELYTQLTKANVYSDIDNKFENKKITPKELKELLKNTLKLETPYINSFAAVEVISDEEATAEEVTKVIETTIEDKQNEEYVLESTEIAVDSARYSTYNDYSYYEIKDIENLYKLKTTKEVLEQKWIQVLDYYIKQNDYDDDLVKIIKKELLNEGFTIKLFSQFNKELKNTDFRSIDYLFKYYEVINKKVEIQEIMYNDSIVPMEEVADYYGKEYYDDEKSIYYVLEEVFRNNTNNNYNFSNEYILKTLSYYKKYNNILIENNIFSTHYLDALLTNIDILNDRNELYDSFEKHYNSIITDSNLNVIESLDEAFSKVDSYDYQNDWTSFKFFFSQTSNSIAWSVVENERDSELIKKAIKWSETSLKVEKNNHYYLDTLAQLYYKNGQKQKGIETEEKAIKFAQENEDDYNIEEYKNVLEKMQNGTY